MDEVMLQYHREEGLNTAACELLIACMTEADLTKLTARDRDELPPRARNSILLVLGGVRLPLLAIFSIEILLPSFRLCLCLTSFHQHLAQHLAIQEALDEHSTRHEALRKQRPRKGDHIRLATPHELILAPADKIRTKALQIARLPS